MAAAPPVSVAQIARAMPAGLAVLDTNGKWAPAAHHSLINQQLLDIAAGRVKRLIVNLPPQHGKSTECSEYFPAWFIGNWPTAHINLVSYEQHEAVRHGRKARDILKRHARLFGVQVREDVESAGDWMTTQGGGVFSTGIGGPLTGRPGNVLIDDPVKNAEEATSETIQERNIDWWKTVARPRLQPHCWVIVIQTRWAERDLAGYLIEEDPDEWTVLRLPALAEDPASSDDVQPDPLGRKPGEPLWPEMFRLADYHAIEATLGPSWWASLYQGRPAPLEGAMFRRAWFRYYETQTIMVEVELEDGARKRVPRQHVVLKDAERERVYDVRDCEVFHTKDAAETTGEKSDWTVLASWLVTPDSDLLLWDLVRVKEELAELRALARNALAQHGGVLHIEKKSHGTALIQDLEREGVPLVVFQPEGNKVLRARVAEARYSRGKVWHPRPGERAWVRGFEDELLKFPKGKHDDQVDVTSHACIVLATRVEVRARFIDLPGTVG
ncbi:MAG TPA: phage terminase large subunit [Candidatus Thermoplasmatota archaeon]|nr:phage terminase large subunit [Candidatus Thermoplasmatota archaeon]